MRDHNLRGDDPAYFGIPPGNQLNLPPLPHSIRRFTGQVLGLGTGWLALEELYREWWLAIKKRKPRQEFCLLG